jgi:hypothetical protein
MIGNGTVHPKSSALFCCSRFSYGFGHPDLPFSVRVADHRLGEWKAYYTLRRLPNRLVLVGFIHGEPPGEIRVGLGTIDQIIQDCFTEEESKTVEQMDFGIPPVFSNAEGRTIDMPGVQEAISVFGSPPYSIEQLEWLLKIPRWWIGGVRFLAMRRAIAQALGVPVHE